MSSFDKWFRTTMHPAECDDERVIVGLKICWEDALLHAAELASAYSVEVIKTDGTDSIQIGKLIASELRKEVEG